MNLDRLARSMKLTLFAVLVLAFLAAESGMHAAVKLPSVISDHMVLQAGAPVTLWGWADAGEAVTVSLADQTHSTKADGSGRWKVVLGKLQTAGEPQTLTTRGTNPLSDWRARWGDEFYFAWVQLPGFQRPQKLPSEPTGWGVAVRDEMRKALDVPRTGMAITIDLGGEKAGHPTNKADCAARLSRLLLHEVYAQPVAIWSGPLFHSAQRDGGKLTLTFQHATGLRAKEGEFQGFAIAGDDRKFVWAEAEIIGDKVSVWSEAVKAPTAVRYGWAANPMCNLLNAAGLPASPFRTDDWE